MSSDTFFLRSRSLVIKCEKIIKWICHFCLNRWKKKNEISLSPFYATQSTINRIEFGINSRFDLVIEIDKRAISIHWSYDFIWIVNDPLLAVNRYLCNQLLNDTNLTRYVFANDLLASIYVSNITARFVFVAPFNHLTSFFFNRLMFWALFNQQRTEAIVKWPIIQSSNFTEIHVECNEWPRQTQLIWIKSNKTKLAFQQMFNQTNSGQSKNCT